MLQRISIDQAAGKTISRVLSKDNNESGDRALFIFTDGTYLYGVVRSFYPASDEDGELDWEYDDSSRELLKSFDSDKLLQLGLVTKQDVEARERQHAEEIERRRRLEEERERKELDRLKAKFEGT